MKLTLKKKKNLQSFFISSKIHVFSRFTFILRDNPAIIYLFKVNNRIVLNLLKVNYRDTKIMSVEVALVYIVNFEQICYLGVVCL